MSERMQERDPLDHTRRVRQRLREPGDHLRSDIETVCP
jgi:hypothetical protein